jgi:hypothetical protein
MRFSKELIKFVHETPWIFAKTYAGFFVLAVHSLVEGVLRERYTPPGRDEDNFYRLIDSVREDCCEGMRMRENKGEIVIYTDANGSVQTEVRLKAESLWLTQNQLEKLFATDRTSVVKHIKNILETGELGESDIERVFGGSSVSANFHKKPKEEVC